MQTLHISYIKKKNGIAIHLNSKWKMNFFELYIDFDKHLFKSLL